MNEEEIRELIKNAQLDLLSILDIKLREAWSDASGCCTSNSVSAVMDAVEGTRIRIENGA